MRGRTMFAGGVVSTLRVRDNDIVAVQSILSNTKNTLRGVRLVVGPWKEPIIRVSDVVGFRDIPNEQDAILWPSLILRFIILSHSTEAIEIIMC